MTSKSMFRRLASQHASLCFDCIRDAGGVFLDGEVNTVSNGRCPACGRDNIPVVAMSDAHYKNGVCKYVWD